MVVASDRSVCGKNFAQAEIQPTKNSWRVRKIRVKWWASQDGKSAAAARREMSG
jgi:hypothetical protein